MYTWVTIIWLVVSFVLTGTAYADNTDLSWAAKYLLPKEQLETPKIAEWTANQGYILGLDDSIIIKLRFDQTAIDTFKIKADGVNGFGLDIDINECNDTPQLETIAVTSSFPSSVGAVRDTTFGDSVTNNEKCDSNQQMPHQAGSLMLKNPENLEAEIDYYVFFKLKNCIPAGGTNLHLTLQLTQNAHLTDMLAWTGSFRIFIEGILSYFGNLEHQERFDYFVVESDSYLSFTAKPTGFGGTCWNEKTVSDVCTVDYQDVCSGRTKNDLQQKQWLSPMKPQAYVAACGATAVNCSSIRVGDLGIPFDYEYAVPPSPPPPPAKAGDANVKSVLGALHGSNDLQHELLVPPGTVIDLWVEGDNKSSTAKVSNSRFKYYVTYNGDKTFNENPNLYLADDDNIDIEPGATVSERKQNIQVPSEPGTYYYYLKISYDADSNQENNVSSSTNSDEYCKVTVLANSVKGVSFSFSPANTIRPGDILKIQTWWSYTGPGVSKDIRLAYFANSSLLGTGVIRRENLTNGVTKKEDFSFNAPSTPGNYVLTAQIDPDGFITGDNTGDNKLTTSFVVQPLPPPPPVIYILNPTPGERWKHNEDHHIRWRCQNIAANKRMIVQFSLDDGRSWTTIDGNAPNDGSKRWTMKNFKNIKSDTSSARIRILWTENQSVYAVSERFSIDYKKK